MESAGELRDIQCQVTVKLTAGVNLRVDFTAWDMALEERVFIEYKGFETPEWLLKKKLWYLYGAGRLRIYKGYGHRMSMVEEIIPPMDEGEK